MIGQVSPGTRPPPPMWIHGGSRWCRRRRGGGVAQTGGDFFQHGCWGLSLVPRYGVQRYFVSAENLRYFVRFPRARCVGHARVFLAKVRFPQRDGACLHRSEDKKICGPKAGRYRRLVTYFWSSLTKGVQFGRTPQNAPSHWVSSCFCH